jgi:dinuclear metal center YbgI/SA1388 family protein
MVTLTELAGYCGELLDVRRFQDYCPNGIQVEGRERVARLVSGVTASRALIDAAVTAGADLILVHHGYFWKGEDPCVTGMKQRRLKTLLAHDISLLAYHLPLDAHPVLGNNAQLAARLGWSVEQVFAAGDGPELGCATRLDGPTDPPSLQASIATALQREPLLIDAGPARIERIGWCTGAAQSYLEAAAELGLDAFVSGEISEQTVHIAREYGIHYFAAGHHATERYGVQALGEHLAERFGLGHEFIDIDNPV